MNEIRNTKYEPRATSHERRGFTLVELVVAIGIMAMVVLFAGTVFKASIGSYRIATAQAEIMQKFRAITNQLNNNFQGLQKDGYLILYSENLSGRTEYRGAIPASFRSDRIYFFCTGDFQSWYDPTVRSNIARIYLGHEQNSIFDSTIYVNHWRLAQDILLLSTAASWPDVNDVNYAWCQVHPTEVLNDANTMLITNPPDVNYGDPNTIRRLLCENAGQFKIEWTDSTIDIADSNTIAWFGLGNPRKAPLSPSIPAEPAYSSIEPVDPPSLVLYRAIWLPSTPAVLWPKALKFTFTLYDSRGVFKDGQTFTHIVYIGD